MEHKEISGWDIKLGERGFLVWAATWLVMSHLNGSYFYQDDFFYIVRLFSSEHCYFTSVLNKKEGLWKKTRKFKWVSYDAVFAVILRWEMCYIQEHVLIIILLMPYFQLKLYWDKIRCDIWNLTYHKQCLQAGSKSCCAGCCSNK